MLSTVVLVSLIVLVSGYTLFKVNQKEELGIERIRVKVLEE